MTLDYVRQAIMVGEGCQVVSYTNLYTNQTTLYRASADWATIHTVSYPSGWNMQAYSSDILLAVSNDKLYRYDSATYEITPLFTFPKSYSRYAIKNTYNRVVVSAAQTVVSNSQTTPPTNTTNYTVFVFSLAQGQAKLVHQFDVNGVL